MLPISRIAAAGLAFALVTPAAADPQITSFSLDNGMQAVVIEDHRAPVVTHMVWYPMGSADEPWGKSGIAHFLEHLMFKGTDEIADGEFSKIIAANGGSDNAFTSYDYTGYFQRIASDRLELVMRMESDRMRDLVVTEAEVETERSVILEERSQRTDNSPQSLFSEQLRAALFQNHPYGVPVIGWRHEMEALTLEDALAFYRRFYAPDNAYLVVAGNVDPSEVKRLAEQYYGPLEPSNAPPDARPSEPPQRAARRVDMEDPRVRQPYVMRSYLVPSRGTGDARQAAALMLLSSIIGDGVNSRLAKKLELADKTATQSGAWYYANARDASEFTIYGVPAPEVDLATVEAGIDAVLAKIAEAGPTEEELARVKRLAKADLIFTQDSQSSMARRYGQALAIGLTIEDVANWPEAIQSVTLEDVREAAESYLVPERSVTGWLTQAKKEQG